MKTATIEALEVLTTIGADPDAEWDEMPQLILINDENTKFVVALAGQDEVPDQVFGIAKLFHSGYITAFTGELVGAILCSEAYALRSQKADDPDGEKLAARAEALRTAGQRFDADPESVEIKAYFAIDADGITQRTIERGSPEVQATDEDDERTMTGHIPTAMRYLLTGVRS